MRIGFLGLPLAGVLLARDGHDIALAVLCRSDCVGGRRLRRLIGAHRVHERKDLSDADLMSRMRAAKPDLIVSWFWTAKLSIEVVALAPRGGIGVHPSLLPRHRGPDPYFAAIDAGDGVTGVTAHRIAADYDTGPMLGQIALPIDPGWSAWQLARKLDRPSLSLLRSTVGRIAAGETLAETVQDERLATWAGIPTSEDCALVWSWTTERLLRRIRALAPAPGAFTEVGGKIITILRARPSASFPRALLPGEAAAHEGVALVRTGDGALDLLEGEVDGRPVGQKGLFRIVVRAGRGKMVG